jgi:hypothetical protein
MYFGHLEVSTDRQVAQKQSALLDNFKSFPSSLPDALSIAIKYTWLTSLSGETIFQLPLHN